jgi:hypothetical protein
MRLWHLGFLDVLPDDILTQLWKDCCEIARQINVEGVTEDILVNRVLESPPVEFLKYGVKVWHEMRNRDLDADIHDFAIWMTPNCWNIGKEDTTEYQDLFSRWHTNRYMWQCYTALEELYDCKAISNEDWAKIDRRMRSTWHV